MPRRLPQPRVCDPSIGDRRVCPHNEVGVSPVSLSLSLSGLQFLHHDHVLSYLRPSAAPQKRQMATVDLCSSDGSESGDGPHAAGEDEKQALAALCQVDKNVVNGGGVQNLHGRLIGWRANKSQQGWVLVYNVTVERNSAVAERSNVTAAAAASDRGAGSADATPDDACLSGSNFSEMRKKAPAGALFFTSAGQVLTSGTLKRTGARCTQQDWNGWGEQMLRVNGWRSTKPTPPLPLCRCK